MQLWKKWQASQSASRLCRDSQKATNVESFCRAAFNARQFMERHNVRLLAENIGADDCGLMVARAFEVASECILVPEKVVAIWESVELGASWSDDEVCELLPDLCLTAGKLVPDDSQAALLALLAIYVLKFEPDYDISR